MAVRIPQLGWVLRGFYGRFYQPPPLTSMTGPALAYALGNNTTFVPLRGERDEEHQFGLQIPWRGWLLDADTFQTRANNFLDHSNIGESSIFIPVTVDGALIQGWELTLRSPRLAHIGQAHLAYSNQIAQQRGAITGGLICYPPDSADCAVEPGYSPLDHDQRNTLNVGFDANLPKQRLGLGQHLLRLGLLQRLYRSAIALHRRLSARAHNLRSGCRQDIRRELEPERTIHQRRQHAAFCSTTALPSAASTKMIRARSTASFATVFTSKMRDVAFAVQVPSVCERPRSRLLRGALYWHLLSLDAPTVAVLWAWSFDRAVGCPTPSVRSPCSALGTWLIYVADRLLDARPAPSTAARSRGTPRAPLLPCPSSPNSVGCGLPGRGGAALADQRACRPWTGATTPSCLPSPCCISAACILPVSANASLVSA